MTNGHRLRPDEIVSLIADYKAGLMWRQIADKYQINPASIVHILRRNNIAVSRIVRTTPSQREEIVRRFAAGDRSRKIADDYGFSQSSVVRLAYEAGVPMRKSKRKKLDDTAFDEITRESAYWAGMLLADGYVTGSKIGLGLKLADRGHIEEFREFVQSGHSLTISGPVHSPFSADDKRIVHSTGRCSISFTSPHMVSTLAALGITPRKSLVAKAPDVLLNNRDFWRGCVDGDGSVYIHRKTGGGSEYPGIMICGSYDLCLQFGEFTQTIYPHRRNPTRAKKGSVYYLSLVGRSALAVIRSLYSHATVALPRKHDTATRLMVRFS